MKTILILNLKDSNAPIISRRIVDYPKFVLSILANVLTSLHVQTTSLNNAINQVYSVLLMDNNVESLNLVRTTKPKLSVKTEICRIIYAIGIEIQK